MYVYKRYPIIVAEQIIDNNEEENFKPILTIHDEKPFTSIIDEQQILFDDQQTEKTSVLPSTTRRYQSSKGKLNSSKTIHRLNLM
jgi:hypothetical protein